MPASPRDLTFISYSHKDKVWLDKLLDTLKPLVGEGSVAPWADTRIQPGDQWRQEIRQALQSSRVAVLLVSRAFLASDFIAKQELPALLNKAKAGGLTILWVHLSASLYEATEIEGYQAVHDISKPLDSLSEAEQSKVLVEIARKIRDAVETRRGDSEASAFQDELQEAIKGLRPFRHEDAQIFGRLGRNTDVDLCARAIADPEFRFGILSGESGCGKSSFLQAGLWPKLETYRVPHHCVYVKFSDEKPVETIKHAIADTLRMHAADLDGSDFLTVLKAATQATSKPVLLLFDQFEQFFVHCKYRQEREPFIRALADWYEKDKRLSVKILVCIRGDFSDRLVELQKAMSYSIGPGQNFRLEKFEPIDAAKVIKQIAEVEGLPIEERFVEAMVNELAGRDDGLISPAYLQIMAWVVKGQKAIDKRGFTSKTFQKIGGVEGLLERFLADTLDVSHSDFAKETVLKVLVALIDLDRNARAGLMTIEALQGRLKDTLRIEEVPKAVEWLAGQNVRLITQQEQKDPVAYELAHECLIPAVRKLAGRQLSEADRANQLLDRRVNEWLGNARKSSYLFNWIEWRLIERNRPYLNWGPQRNHKEALLQQTKRKWNWTAGAVVIGLFVIQLGLGLLLSPWGQIQVMKWDIAKLSRGNDVGTLKVIATGLSFPGYLEQAAVAAGRINNPAEKAEALGEVAEAMAQVGDVSKAAELLNQAVEAACRIENCVSQDKALEEVARVMGQAGDASKAAELLKQAAETAGRIDDPIAKARALGEVARAMAQAASATRNPELLNQAVEVAGRIEHPIGKAKTLRAVAVAMAQVASATKNRELLKQAAETAGRIEHPIGIDKAVALHSVAVAMAQVASATKNPGLLKQAVEVAHRIKYPIAKARALGEVARAMAQTGDASKAAELLKQAAETAGRIDDPIAKARALGEVARAMAQAGDASKAAELLKQAADEVGRMGSVPNPTLDVIAGEPQVLKEVAQTTAQLGHWRQAREYAAQNVTNEGRAKALIAILKVWHGMDEERAENARIED